MKDYSTQVEKLKMLISHRDNEINILVSMLNKQKGQETSNTPTSISDSSSPTPRSTSHSRSSSAIKTELAATEKAKAFEIFKNGYPAGSWIDGQKALLKTKYTEAKSVGEKANNYRNEISIFY